MNQCRKLIMIQCPCHFTFRVCLFDKLKINGGWSFICSHFCGAKELQSNSFHPINATGLIYYFMSRMMTHRRTHRLSIQLIQLRFADVHARMPGLIWLCIVKDSLFAVNASQCLNPMGDGKGFKCVFVYSCNSIHWNLI